MNHLSREGWHPQREVSEANESSEEFEDTDLFFCLFSYALLEFFLSFLSCVGG